MSRPGRHDDAPTAMDQLAAALAPDLLAAVIEDSRRDAAELLRARLTAALVDRAEQLAAAPPAPPIPAAAAPATAAPAVAAPAPGPTGAPAPPAGWYVYGLTRTLPGPPLTGAGVDGAAVESVEHGGLLALVSPVPGGPATPSGGADDRPCWGLDPCGEVDLEALAPRLEAHERILEAALDRAAVLPFRFGVMYPDRDSVERVLAAHAPAVEAELDRLDGRAEWGVSLHRSIPRPAAGPPLPPGPGGRSPGGRVYLEQRREQRSAAARHDDEAAELAAALHEQLTVLADDAVAHRPDAGAGRGRRGVMRASYLVRTARAREFRRAADELLSAAPPHLGLTGDLTGPWPAYHFVDLDLGAAPIPGGRYGATPAEP